MSGCRVLDQENDYIWIDSRVLSRVYCLMRMCNYDHKSGVRATQMKEDKYLTQAPENGSRKVTMYCIANALRCSTFTLLSCYGQKVDRRSRAKECAYTRMVFRIFPKNCTVIPKPPHASRCGDFTIASSTAGPATRLTL